MPENNESEINHWIIRVNDGENFRNSRYPFWGVSEGRGGSNKTIVGKFKPGDKLWFLTPKKFGGKLIGMAEYVSFHDRKTEPLIQIDSISNKDQNWKGNDDWDIQINYKNLYNTEKQDIRACIQCAATIMKYTSVISKIKDNLYEHSKNFQFYAEPKNNWD